MYTQDSLFQGGMGMILKAGSMSTPEKYAYGRVYQLGQHRELVTRFLVCLLYCTKSSFVAHRSMTPLGQRILACRFFSSDRIFLVANDDLAVNIAERLIRQ